MQVIISVIFLVLLMGLFVLEFLEKPFDVEDDEYFDEGD